MRVYNKYKQTCSKDASFYKCFQRNVGFKCMNFKNVETYLNININK